MTPKAGSTDECSKCCVVCVSEVRTCEELSSRFQNRPSRTGHRFRSGSNTKRYKDTTGSLSLAIEPIADTTTSLETTHDNVVIAASTITLVHSVQPCVTRYSIPLIEVSRAAPTSDIDKPPGTTIDVLNLCAASVRFTSLTMS